MTEAPLLPAIRQWPDVNASAFSSFVADAAKLANADAILEIGSSFGLHLATLPDQTAARYFLLDYGFATEFAAKIAPRANAAKTNYEPEQITAALACAPHGRVLCFVSYRFEQSFDPKHLLSLLQSKADVGWVVLVFIDPSQATAANSPDVADPYRHQWTSKEFLDWAADNGSTFHEVGHVSGDYRSSSRKGIALLLGPVRTAPDSGLQALFPLSLANANRDDSSSSETPLPSPNLALADLTIPTFLGGRYVERPADLLPSHRNLLTTEQTTLRAQRAISERRPFSLIRLGNGEGRVVGFPDFTTPLWLSRSFRNWFGSREPERHIEWFRQALMAAAIDADVIGIPSEPPRDAHWQIARDMMWLYGLDRESQVYCRHSYHLDAMKSGALTALLTGQRQISIISCHDIRNDLARTLNIDDVAWYPVPGQAKFFSNDSIPAHYPDVYDNVVRELTVRTPGELFLIGAGPLGKLYCSLAKSRGGVAIDVGSVLDVWAGHATRTGFQKLLAEHAFSGAALEREGQ